jgi:hypothetical protein
VKATPYFLDQVLRKRPYLKIAWIEVVMRSPVKKEIQPEGRVRYWGFVPELGKYLRVVTLDDGVTVHNAFPDRNFKEG